MIIWLAFLACAAVIMMAGPVLTRQADAIANASGLSRSWVGLILLATATSLPELLTGLSSVTLADAPNIAVGDVLGSCIFNLLLIAVLDLLSRDQSLFGTIDRSHILTATLGLILIGTVGALLIVARGALDFRIAHVSIYSPFLVILYFVAVRASFRHQGHAGGVVSEPQPDARLGPAILRYAGAALVICLAGALLPFIGVALAEAMGWKTSFVGTLFVAAATSLPELVVMLAALRLRAVDMATANLLGSNLFDVLILAIDDFAYTRGALLADASPAHAGSAFAATIMSGIVIIGILDQPRARFFGVIGWISILLVAVYVLSAYSIFLLGQ
ncbi:sodium:calcium antiporter [Stakelama tenebrarum]|uniref:Sodium:calcium antiporter n=1 Tax=Stakelama tenebrarum TaxID=2711215 RepID=A0A6G6Y239_9SPHN|nr:sodium:calcium antiporter [Sphingosinithalassobacter tenebrarum]QIG78877.1 sodium:calcium antiporter [Sphingosinithalassobacter tenebrarum]